MAGTQTQDSAPKALFLLPQTAPLFAEPRGDTSNEEEGLFSALTDGGVVQSQVAAPGWWHSALPPTGLW